MDNNVPSAIAKTDVDNHSFTPFRSFCGLDAQKFEKNENNSPPVVFLHDFVAIWTLSNACGQKMLRYT